MKHVYHKKTERPWAPQHFTLYMKYPTFASFDNASQAGIGAFWQQINNNNYVSSDLAKNKIKIRDKWNDKVAEDITAQITVGWIGQKFLVIVTIPDPNRPNSNEHAYLFFPSADAEINTELAGTFNA